MQFKIICTKTILYVIFVCCWMYPYFLNLLYLFVLQVFAMIGCSPVLALTKVPSYSMTTIIAFQNGLQKSSSSMKVWQSWKYKKFTGLACGDAESKYWIRFSRGGGGEIKKDKRWENFKSDLGVTLQGNRGRLPAHLELLARISSLHHHALKNKISPWPTMHWLVTGDLGGGVGLVGNLLGERRPLGRQRCLLVGEAWEQRLIMLR